MLANKKLNYDKKPKSFNKNESIKIKTYKFQ